MRETLGLAKSERETVALFCFGCVLVLILVISRNGRVLGEGWCQVAPRRSLVDLFVVFFYCFFQPRF